MVRRVVAEKEDGEKVVAERGKEEKEVEDKEKAVVVERGEGVREKGGSEVMD